MKMVKPDSVFEKKLKTWYAGEFEPGFMDCLNRVATSYEKWGRADASKGKQPAQHGLFLAGGKLVFPDDEDASMAEAMAAYMESCYMDGYETREEVEKAEVPA